MIPLSRKLLAFSLFVVIVALAFRPVLLQASEPDLNELQAVWERMRDSGAYNFSTKLTQTLTPAPTAASAGRKVKEHRLQMEGQADMAADTMQMTLWSGGGSVLAPETGLQFKVEDGRSYMREGGASWQPTDDFTTMFAPGGDFMGYVRAAENVVRHDPEWRATIGGDILVTRYTFDINGRKFAQYVRAQMQQQEGLPPGLEVQLPKGYLEMTGQGELLVGPSGMPIRQQFNLQFPESSGYLTSAVVTTDFSNFKALPTLSTAAFVGKTIAETAEAQLTARGMATILLTLIVLLFIAFFVKYRQSRLIYAPVAITIVASMLITPLLTTVHVSAFQDTQAAKQAQQEAQDAEQKAQEEQEEVLLTSSFDPHIDPFQQARQPKAQEGVTDTTTAASVSSDSSSTKYADPLCETDPHGDADSDSLTNLQECLLGTLPGRADTDGDLLNDGIEVGGVALTHNGVTTTWYTDPQSRDSNNDSIPDGKEWHLDAQGSGLPNDTDRDGVPDIWDLDNDGDGVPDKSDLSDYATTLGTTNFDGTNPMQLMLDDLIYDSQVQTADQKLVKVEFQLTPTEAEHLWYTNNVLDWPQNDLQGQIQDADGLTFFDVDSTIDPFPNDYGDMRLVPMLEIEISGTADNLPPAEMCTATDGTHYTCYPELEQFGISIKQTTASTKTAYVPLQLVSDTGGNKNLAFYGRMYYRAGTTWGNAHQVRLVWLVQALVDVCGTYTDGVCTTYTKMNDNQVVQTYDDEWFLTGLHVTEEHNTDMAIIYEDPAITGTTSAGPDYDKPFYMDTLYGLLYGLDSSYLAGSDCETTNADGTCNGNGQRDVTVADIATNFDHGTNGLPITGGEKNLNLPNVLSVERTQYDALDLAIMNTTITKTVGILNNNFSTHWSAAKPITPTIMLAYDHTYRAINLDEMLTGSPNMSLSAQTLTASLPTTGAHQVEPQTIATVKWTPYSYDPDATDHWSSANTVSFWQDMERLLGSSFADISDRDEAKTYQTMSQLIYMSVFGGMQNVVTVGTTINSKSYQQSLHNLSGKIISGVGAVIKTVAKAYFTYSPELKEAAELVNPVTGEATGYGKAIPQFIWQKLSAGLEGGAGIALAVTVVVLLIIAGTAALLAQFTHNLSNDSSWGLRITAAAIVGVIGLAVLVILPLLAAIDLAKSLVEISEDISFGEAFIDSLSADASLVGASRAAGYAGLIISIGVAVYLFIYTVANNHVKAGSIEFNALLAATIATIIVAVIFFVLALTVVGTILVALIVLIDSILAILGVSWSISGWLTQTIASIIYIYKPVGSVDVQTGDLKIILKNPNIGMIAGNQMQYKLPLTTTMTFTQTLPWDIPGFSYGGQIHDDKKRHNTFKYELSFANKTLSASGGEVGPQWVLGVNSNDDSIGTLTGTYPVTKTLTAGVNMTTSLTLNSAYYMVGWNCWVEHCSEHDLSGHSSDAMGQSIAFDIFPATIQEFVDVDTWSKGEVKFFDADGDGLLSLAAGGLDPNPTQWDTDGDGLADGYEAALRAKTAAEGGVNLNLLSPDSDGDLIGDGDEIRLSTNPGNNDTDDDGIPDIEEVAYVVDVHGNAVFGGWDLPYAPNKTVRVVSDPLHADADGDGLSDLFERTQDTCPTCLPWQDINNPLVYSPYVWNESPVPLYYTDNTERGFVAPGASFVYTTTTANNLSSGQSLVGNLSLELPGSVSGGPLTAGVDIPSGHDESLVSQLSASNSGQSTSDTLTSHMQLTDLGSVVWSWDKASEAKVNTLSGNIQDLKAASSQGWEEPYLIVTLETPPSAAGSFKIVGYQASGSGHVIDSRVLYQSGSGEVITLEETGLACTDDGDCLIVFVSEKDNLYHVKSLVLRQQLASSTPSILWEDNVQPTKIVVASNPDGAQEGFMLSWTVSKGGDVDILTLPILDNGAAPTNDYIDASGNIKLQSRPVLIATTSDAINLAGLTWGGTAYQLFVDELTANQLVVFALDPQSGADTGGNFLQNATYHSAAYDEVSKQTLLLHGYYDQGGLSATIVRPDLAFGSDTNLGTGSSTALCADPKNGGWLAAWDDGQLHWQAVGPSGAKRGLEHTTPLGETNPLITVACEYPSPILDLHFDEPANASVFADTSGQGNTARCTSGTCPTSGAGGRFDNGISLNGSEHLTVADTIDLANKSFSISAWAKHDAANPDGLILFQGLEQNNHGLQFGFSKNRFNCGFWNDDLLTNAIQPDDEWHHWSCTYDHNTRQRTIYRDGQVLKGPTQAAANYQGTGTLFIGSLPNQGLGYSGALDNVKIWSRVLTNSEIGDAFNSATAVFDLDEIAGSTALIDSSNNGFNASCSAAAGTCPTMGAAGKAETAAQFDGVNDFLVIEPISQTVAVYGYTFDTADSALLFDDPVGTSSFHDASGQGNNATCSDSCPESGVAGHTGNGIYFSDFGDYLTIPGDLSLEQSAFTVAAWVKRDATSQNMAIVSQGDVATENQWLHIGFRDNNKFTCAFFADDLDTTKAYTDAGWHHWVCSYDWLSNVRTIYRDGQLVASDKPLIQGISPSGPIHIGNRSDGLWQFWGTLDDVGIWRRSLTTEEVGRLYQEGLTAYTGKLDGWNKQNIAQLYSEQNLGGNTVLGFWDNSVTRPQLTLDGLPIHDTVELKFDLRTVGSWDGTNTTTGPDQWQWGTAAHGDAFSTSFLWLGHDANDYTGYYQAYPDPSSTFSPGQQANPPLSHNTGSFSYFIPGVSNFTGFSYALDGIVNDHIGDTLTTYFELNSRGLPTTFKEQFALDNVVATIKRENTTIPLAGRSFTLSAWVKRTPNGNFQTILSQGSIEQNKGLVLGFRGAAGGDVFTCAFYGNDLDTPIGYTDTGWHHWACTYDAETNLRTIYRDTVKVAQDTAGSDYLGHGATYIGALFNPPPNRRSFNGTIDEAAIWTEALTADDIAVLYSKVKAQDESIVHALLPYAVGGEPSLALENLELRETATIQGAISGSTDRTITIDTLNPVICPNDANGSSSCPPPDQYVNAAGTMAVSGTAVDATSFINVVEVDNGGWKSTGVDGTEAWSYSWDISALSDGRHTLPVRAVDAVGHVSPSKDISIIIDRTPPNVTIDGISGPVRPYQNANGHWAVSLSGTVNEPNAGGRPGSGLVSVEAIVAGSGNLAGQSWQQAAVSGSTWQLEYILPTFGAQGDSMADPSGTYTVRLRATDKIGNTTTPASQPTQALVLDATAPPITLITPPASMTVISKSLTLAGTINGVSPSDVVEINFSSAEQLGALIGTALHLPFDETQHINEYFRDQSGAGNAAVCRGVQCPAVGQEGKRAAAVAFNGSNNHLSAAGINLADASFTLSAWLKNNKPGEWNIALSQGEPVEGKGLHFGFNGGPFICGFWSDDLVTADRYTDTDWHHWSCTYDATTKLRAIYRDGVQVAQNTAAAHYSGSGAYLIGRVFDNPTPFTNNFNGLMDELTVHNRALSAYEVANLHAYGSGTWTPVNRSGSSWSYTIPEGSNGLEGFYQINMRAVDALGNVTQQGDQSLWRGEIDTRPPQLDFTINTTSVLGSVVTTKYSCHTSDLNLVENSCQPVDPSTMPGFGSGDLTLTTYDQVDPWYAVTIGDTSRLYKIDAQHTFPFAAPTAGAVQACDKYNHCTTATDGSNSNAGVSMEAAASLDTAVLKPAGGTVLTTLDPVKVEGYALAEAYLKELLVTINNAPAYEDSWDEGAAQESQWSFDWTPPEEGIYRFTPRVNDWNEDELPSAPHSVFFPLVTAFDQLVGRAVGTSAPNTTKTGETATIYVDTTPPTITIDPLILTQDDLVGGNIVNLYGTAGDTVRVHRVEVSIDNGPWQPAGLDADGRWNHQLVLAEKHDGHTLNIRARATDLADNTAVANEDVIVDITGPEHDEITLSYINEDGQIHEATPGMTLRDALTLQVSWTEGADEHGVAGYEAAFTENRTPPPTGSPQFSPYPGPDTHQQDPAGEAKTWFAHVTVFDVAGNSLTETIGPIYVDAPLTPDIVDDLHYYGWTDSECTIQGVDRRLAQRHPHAFGNDIQTLFTSWDEHALRLSWNGAHWQQQGDLFVYLDTQIGGARQLFNPYPEDKTTIYLPGNTPDTTANGGRRQIAALDTLSAGQAMQADFMVWVKDDQTATLWSWNGVTWQNEGVLDQQSFHHRTGLEVSDTDIRLPFELVGIFDPAAATLGLLAVASEEDSLELWATMPSRNPLNSPRLLDGHAGQEQPAIFTLSQAYFWDGLGSGLCPNGRLNSDGSGPTGGAFADSDLQVTLSAKPAGTIYHFLSDGLTPWWTLLFGHENVPYVPSLLFEHRDNNHPPLGQGDIIEYTVSYVNNGSEAASGVELDIQSWLSLDLPHNIVDLGDIAPGSSGSYQFTGTVDVYGEGQEAYHECRLNFPPEICERTRTWAALDVYVYDDQSPRDPVDSPWTQPPLEWIWSDHPVDSAAPSDVGIISPTSVIPAAEVMVRGFAHDESAVTLITLQSNVGGSVSSIDCPQAANTYNGRWTCNWNPGAASDGESVALRARATDEYGHISEWSEWINLTVDSTPPTITVNHGVDGETLGSGAHTLSGVLNDSHPGGQVQLCVGDEFPCQTVAVDPETGNWSAQLSTPDSGAPDALPVTLHLHGIDAAGNGSTTPVTINYLLDQVAPELEVTTVIEEVDENTTGPILSGTASDGSDFDVTVEIRSPSGADQISPAAVSSGEWSFSHNFSEIGPHRAWVRAVDITGNRRTNGPYIINVK